MKKFLPSATREPHGMGGRLGPSGLLKASLNESNRQQIHQNVKCYIIHWNLYTKRVSKPSIFLTSYLLNFFLFPWTPCKSFLLLINKELRNE
jgi:hypothetical protein